MEKDIGRLLTMVGNQMRRKLEEISIKYDFTCNQGRVLCYILTQSRMLCQRNIEKQYGLRPSSASVLLQQMEKAGLITRVPSEEDSRKKYIQVTDKSFEYKEDLMTDIARLEEQIAAGIDEEDMNTFVRVLKQVSRNLEE